MSAVAAGCAAPQPAPTTRPEDSSRPTEVVRGEPVILPGQTAAFIPTSGEDQTLAIARVVGVDIQGKITVASARGPVEVWVPDPDRYHFGDQVEIQMIVRTGEFESLPDPSASARGAAPRWTDAGHHAVVIGRVLSVQPRGTIAVESQRGPIRVWVTLSPDRYRPGGFVEVRTRVRPAP